jgi:hypothetical protein
LLLFAIEPLLILGKRLERARALSIVPLFSARSSIPARAQFLGSAEAEVFRLLRHSSLRKKRFLNSHDKVWFRRRGAAIKF